MEVKVQTSVYSKTTTVHMVFLLNDPIKSMSLKIMNRTVIVNLELNYSSLYLKYLSYISFDKLILLHLT